LEKLTQELCTIITSQLDILSNYIKAIGLFMVTAGLAAVYGITTFGPKLSLQNKVLTMKVKMKELMLTHNNQVVS
jgi:hypothetical protein